MFNRFAAFIILNIALILAASCAKPAKLQTPPSLPQARAFHIQQLQQLKNVHFVQMGEILLVSLPSDKIFYPNSVNLSPAGQSYLEPLTKLLATYQIQTLQIIGYNDDFCVNAAYNRAFTEKQAQQIAKYFTDYGLDARLVYAMGFGAAAPIASNSSRIGRLLNRRIDIYLRFVSGLNE